MATVPLKVSIPGVAIRTVEVNMSLTVLKSEWEPLRVGNRVVCYLSNNQWVTLNSPNEFLALALKPMVTLGILGHQDQILSNLLTYEDLKTFPNRLKFFFAYLRVIEKVASEFVTNLDDGFANDGFVEKRLKDMQNEKKVEEVVEHEEVEQSIQEPVQSDSPSVFSSLEPDLPISENLGLESPKVEPLEAVDTKDEEKEAEKIEGIPSPAIDSATTFAEPESQPESAGSRGGSSESSGSHRRRRSLIPQLQRQDSGAAVSPTKPVDSPDLQSSQNSSIPIRRSTVSRIPSGLAAIFEKNGVHPGVKTDRNVHRRIPLRKSAFEQFKTMMENAEVSDAVIKQLTFRIYRRRQPNVKMIKINPFIYYDVYMTAHKQTRTIKSYQSFKKHFWF